jgi:hypothetical protein
MNYKNLIQVTENEDEVSADYLFERIRNWRNTELAASDWTQIADSTADKEAWATYRQKLRNLPASNLDPKKIVFPSRPA